MPYQTVWVEPAVFMDLGGGRRIFHVYKDDDVDQGARTYWYTTSRTDGEGSSAEFDVRELSTWQEEPERPSLDGIEFNTPEWRVAYDTFYVALDEAIRAAIKAAVESGELKVEAEEICRTCSRPLSDDAGEGYDGQCGNCADKAAAAEQEAR